VVVSVPKNATSGAVDSPETDGTALDQNQTPHEAQTDSSASVDPYDLDALAVEDEDISTAARLLAISARKPGSENFFRVRDGVDSTGRPYYLDTRVLVDKVEMREDTYLVAAPLQKLLESETKRVRIYVCMDRRGVLFLWPIKIPTGDGAGQAWLRSALAAAERAKTTWVKIRGNREAGAYELTEAAGKLSEPDWPDIPFGELLRLAYPAERMIASLDHDLLRKRRGEI
jgi:hypothetical protein